MNGVVERMIRTINESVVCNIKLASTPLSLWHYAYDYAFKTYNRTPKKAIDFEIPIVKLFGMHVDVSKLKVCGSVAFALEQQPAKRTKLSSHVKPTGRFMSLAPGDQGYVILLSTCHITVTRHAEFDESFDYPETKG